MGNVDILKASAGSGKTYRLVYKYIKTIVDDPSSYRHTLAVTFTNKATEEMKQRIVRELGSLSTGGQSPYMTDLCDQLGLSADQVRERARKAQGNILHDYSHFWVLTIDKFFQNIIRSFLRELGISPDFNIELHTDSLLETAADALIEKTATDEGLRAWVGEFVDEQLDEGAGWDVRSKLAAAGREIFTEDWDFEADPAEGHQSVREKLGEVMKLVASEREKVFAQMKKAASDALGIIDEAGLTIDDFAYKSGGVGGYFYKIANGKIDGYGKHVTAALEDDAKWAVKSSTSAALVARVIPRLRPCLEQICSLWDANHRLIYSDALVRKRFRSFGLLHDMVREVRLLCHEQNIMPISRTNRILQHLIAENETPFIFEKAGTHFTNFLIDEFQDTSRMQWENFVPLLRNALSQSAGAPVMLVGDVKQSIYRWRGGDWKILSADAGRTLGCPEPENMTINRRSLENVVRFNNAAISECVGRDLGDLQNLLGQAAEGGYISTASKNTLVTMLAEAYDRHEQSPVDGRQGGYVTMTFTREAQDEEPATNPVIARVEELQRRGYNPSDIAILVRRNNEAQEVAKLLLDHKRANPSSPYSYDIVTAEALYVGASQVVEFIAASLGLALDSSDAVSRGIRNRYLGRPFHEEAPPEEQEFIASLALCSPQEAFHKVVIRYNVASREDQIAYLQAFHEQIVRFCDTNIADIALFLRWWNEKGRREAVYMPQSQSAISIITIHKAKGLERKAVIVPYCSWPLAPKTFSTLWVGCQGTPFEELERMAVGYEKSAGQSCFSEDYYTELVLSHIDNINLLYVALTRAREELHLYIPRRKGKEPTESFSTIGDLLVASADLEGGSLGDMPGQITLAGESRTVVEFGAPVPQPAPEARSDERIHTGYPTRDPGMKVKLRLPSSRYLDDEGSSPALSPRSYGMLMHKVFENARTRADLESALCSLQQDGLLSATEAQAVEAMIRTAMEDPLIGSWFSDEWEIVRNENDIIVPRAGQRRPDRVMTRGREAVVVDYKFGSKIEPEHRKQVAAYRDLLTRMGYEHTEGYLWYVTLGEVVTV